MTDLRKDPLIPGKAIITAIRQDTQDIKTYQVRDINGGKPFDFEPGQCAMLSLPPAGEAIFSITSSPLAEMMEFSIKNAGRVTSEIHNLKIGDQIGIRGPYGTPFPVTDFEDKDLLFIGGGIGLAPLRSVIKYVLKKRDNFGKVDIVCGCRTCNDFVHYQEITEVWPEKSETNVYLTVDKATDGWTGFEGYVPEYIDKLGFSPEGKTAIVCGPPIMIKFVVQQLKESGFDPADIYTTLELKMKCGIGKCGRCNIGSKYVCKDGPVFTAKELSGLIETF